MQFLRCFILKSIQHRITQAEITWNMISVGQHEKRDFYSQLPENFTVKIGMYISKNRKIGKRKISVGKRAMKQFKPFELVTIQIKNNELIIEV